MKHLNNEKTYNCMKNKVMLSFLIIFFLFVFMFLISFVSAENVFKEDTIVDLKVHCINNNTYCSRIGICNLTILDSESNFILNNVVMQNQSAYHNYTLNLTHTSESGEFTRNVVCFDNGLRGYSSDTFKITPTGNALDQPSALSMIIILLIMFGVTIFFLIFSKQTTNPPIQLFFNLISYITMALTVGAGWILLQSSGVQSNISELMIALMFVVGIVFTVIMYYVFINSTRQALALMKAKRGFSDDEDFDF